MLASYLITLTYIWLWHNFTVSGKNVIPTIKLSGFTVKQFVHVYTDDVQWFEVEYKISFMNDRGFVLFLQVLKWIP